MGARLISPVDPWFINQRLGTLEARSALAAAFPSSAGDRMLVEGGVLPAVDDTAFATVSSGTTSSPTVTVGSGRCVVPVTGHYGYECAWPAGQGPIALAAPPSTNPRVDLLVARVYNPEHGDSLTGFYLETIDGTPASSPQPPSVPAGAIPLKNVQVATTGVLTITDRITFTRGAGGVRRSVRDTTRAGSHPADLRISDAGVLDAYVGGAWQTLASPAVWSQFTPVLKYSGAANQGTGDGGTVSLGTGSTAIGRYIVIGKTCTLRYVFRAGTVIAAGSGAIYSQLPPGLTSAPQEETQILAKLNTLPSNTDEIWQGVCYIPPNSIDMYLYFPRSATDCRILNYIVATSAGAAGTGIPYIAGGFPDPEVLVVQGQIELS